MGTSSGETERWWLLLELPLGEAAETFDLEKAVCSHGLFMMSPNRWDPLTRTLSRPLRLHPALDHDDGDEISVVVRISHPQPHSLRIHVYGAPSLSPDQRQSLLGQVTRMLRLSETDERNAREFRDLVSENAKEEYLRCFGGRVFRSPSLFEDMVKCILLCNCRWPRTLSMANALCELQWELKCPLSSGSVAEAVTTKSASQETESKNFIPKTPAGKESKRKKKMGVSQLSRRLKNKSAETKADSERDVPLTMNSVQMRTENLTPSLLPVNIDDNSCQISKSCQITEYSDKTVSYFLSEHHFPRGMGTHAHDRIGNFPSPRELANLDESFLAKRCNLGYRASRILKLAQGIVEGRIQLRQLEEACKERNLSSYDKLVEHLSEIDGFGPFTCANVLVCMGFYHVIPTDSETVRHLKQVHAKESTIQTVQRHVEAIYGEYAPFQFLAYWAELWHFYGQRFGKLSEMPHTDYKLITASNMRIEGHKNKRTKTS